MLKLSKHLAYYQTIRKFLTIVAVCLVTNFSEFPGFRGLIGCFRLTTFKYLNS